MTPVTRPRVTPIQIRRVHSPLSCFLIHQTAATNPTIAPSAALPVAEEPETSGAKIAGSMAPQTGCLRVTQQSDIERTGAEGHCADDEQSVLKASHGANSLHQ